MSIRISKYLARISVIIVSTMQMAVLPRPIEVDLVEPVHGEDIVISEPDSDESHLMDRIDHEQMASPDVAALPGAIKWFVGIGTHFDALGYPYGGCGVPESAVSSTHYVALNVVHTPKDYREFPNLGVSRPLPDSARSILGSWNNGRNCGRWIDVHLGRYCTGKNSGVPGTSFCDGGSWVDDNATGASLRMIVTDSCTDNNTFCRDSFYHLDLHRTSLKAFSKNGQQLTDLEHSKRWNNREILWRYVKAPNYRGDIKIGFGKDSGKYWQNVIITHLENGLSRVEFKSKGEWTRATMNSDMGQNYIVPQQADRPLVMRVFDVDGVSVKGGQTYTFDLPKSCAPKCVPAITPVNYTN